MTQPPPIAAEIHEGRLRVVEEKLIESSRMDEKKEPVRYVAQWVEDRR